MLEKLDIPDEHQLAEALLVELRPHLPSGSRIVPWRRGADFFAMRVVTDHNSAELVLRVPLREILTSAYDGTVDFGDVVVREARVHDALAAHGVPTAPLVGWGRADGLYSHSWMLFQRVPNDDRTELTAAHSEALGAVLRQIHNIALDPDLVETIGTDTSPESMAQRIDSRVRALADRTDSPHVLDVLDPVMSIVDRRRGQGECCLTHMDLRPENLCFQGDDLVAVLDLSNATFGDPLAELGRMAAYGTLSEELLAAYGTEGVDQDAIAAYAVDTYALLGLLGADEFADQALVDRGLRGIEASIQRLRR